MTHVDFKTAPHREAAYDFMRKYIAENPDTSQAVFFEEVLNKTGMQFGMVLPGPGRYGLDKFSPHFVVIDDGTGTHERFGTTLGPQSFDLKQLSRLLQRAKAVLVNSCVSDRWVGEFVLNASKTLGLTVLIDTEGDAWADWARLVRKNVHRKTVGIRIPPDTIIPDDLIGYANHDWLKSQATVH